MAYIKVGSNGKIILNIAEIPQEKFLKATRHKELCLARVLNLDERKQRGVHESNVYIKTSDNSENTITRKELTEQFMFSNGRPIKLRHMRTGINYIVTRQCQQPCMCLRITPEYAAYIKGRVVSGDKYIIINIVDGQPDMESISAISAEAFKRQFSIPKQRLLNRKARKARLLKRENTKKLRQQSYNDFNSDFDNIEEPIFNNKVTNKKSNSNVEKTKKVQDKSSNSKYKYEVTHRVVDIDDSRHLLGYRIKDIASGRTTNVSVKKMHDLCEKNYISNVELIQKAGYKKKFLKGKGIVLDKLPQVIEERC